MEPRELHLELLLGRQVHDTTGKPVGRIEEVWAEQQGQDWVIQEYLVGSTAILERLSVWTIGLKLLHLLGASQLFSGWRVPWNKLDLSDPEHPRLNCTLEQLKLLAENKE
jgi:sporulation protein YlmC with PRC-barrel domain